MALAMPPSLLLGRLTGSNGCGSLNPYRIWAFTSFAKQERGLAMRCFRALVPAFVLACFLAGCASVKISGGRSESVPPDSAAVLEENGMAEVREEEAVLPERPAKEEVLAAREKALVGMSQEQAGRLKEVITAANLRLEQGYLSENLFEKLEDPDSLTWNCFDKTGEIQVGWAYDGGLDMEAVCGEEDLTENAFYAQYGSRVLAANDYAADDFIFLIKELAETVQNESLRADLQYMAAEMELAKGHEAEHVGSVYKKLHDLDYFLLRYGPEDFGMYAMDRSAASKYYGTLSFYA